MAEKPRRKKPANGGDNPGKHDAAADTFAPFEDWLKAGPAGKWPDHVKDRELTVRQKEIVVANAMLLRDSRAWCERIDMFEKALSKIKSEDMRKQRRAEYEIHFDCYEFDDGDKNFHEYQFPCSVSFSGAKFTKGYVFFHRAHFSDGDVSFDRANFDGSWVSFESTQFGNGSVSFFGTRFGWSADFRNVQFGNGNVSFVQTHFVKGVSFENARFGDGEVRFSSGRFGEAGGAFDDALFDNAQFGHGTIYFSRTSFGAINVTFRKTRFDNAAVLASDMAVAGNLFVAAKFGRISDFRRLKVEGTTDFSDSSFAEVPDFRDAKLGRSPEVARLVVPAPVLKRVFRDVEKADNRKETIHVRRYFFKRAVNSDDVVKYRKLKAMALAANDHEKDGEFFAYEMLAKRGVETTGLWPLLFNTLYYQLGNFGQSYTRPLSWMLASFAFFTAVYGAIIGPVGGWPSNLLFATDYSFRNSVPLFGALARAVPTPKDHVSSFDKMFGTIERADVNMELIGWLGMAQAFFGSVLLFLLLLALRNKFRLK